MFTYDGCYEGLRCCHSTTWRHRTAGAEGADGGRRHSVRRDQPLLLSRGAGRATTSLAVFRARVEAEALQGGEGVGGQGGDSGAAAATVTMMVFACFGARAAGARSQQDESAVVL